jgi:hypothetical protein
LEVFENYFKQKIKRENKKRNTKKENRKQKRKEKEKEEKTVKIRLTGPAYTARGGCAARCRCRPGRHIGITGIPALTTMKIESPVFSSITDGPIAQTRRRRAQRVDNEPKAI